MAADLVETVRFDPIEGIVELEPCLERMTAQAEAQGFSFDRHDVRNELQAATFRLREEAQVTVRISSTGAAAIVVTPEQSAA